MLTLDVPDAFWLVRFQQQLLHCWISAEDFGRVRAMTEAAPESFTLVASIQLWKGRYLPAIECICQPSGEGWFTTVKAPVKPWRLPINAARTAQHDLTK